MIKLVKPDMKYKKQYEEMIKEWENTGEKIIPFSIRNNNFENFEETLKYFEEQEKGINLKEGMVPSTTLWGYDTDTDKIVGAVNIRHYLNDRLLKFTGHIGYGVRPSERRKGYVTKMTLLALEECKKFGITKALLVCNKENIGSQKTIIKCGGILENEIQNENGEIEQRYWIGIE